MTRAKAAATAPTTTDELGAEVAEQTELIRAVVVCLPPEKAAALLSSNPSTTVVVELPGEVTEP